jgi:peptidoglycan/xylan/chitin deacetylase (PgdA/CDA1 family)
MSDVLVLAYHALSEHWPAALSVPPRALELQLEHLLRAGYRPATFHDAVTAPADEKTMAVTFDDGFRSVLTRGFPTLERLGIPATVFVATAFPDRGQPLSWPGIEHWRGTSYEEELVPLSWKELRDLADAGWEIGSHTRSHPRLTVLEEGELLDELLASRLACERHLDRPCRSLAYPYGAVDARVLRAAEMAGYSAAATLPRRLHGSSLLDWPRVGIYRADGRWRFRLKVSRPVRRLRLDAAPKLAAAAGGRPTPDPET